MPVPVLAKLAGQGRHPWTGVSPPGCHDGAMPARPATIDDIPEVLRLAALMYLTIGQRADEAWLDAPVQARRAELARAMCKLIEHGFCAPLGGRKRRQGLG